MTSISLSTIEGSMSFVFGEALEAITTKFDLFLNGNQLYQLLKFPNQQPNYYILA